MVALIIFATERKHQRLKEKEQADAIKQAENELKKALKDHPQDVVLHSALYERVKRLRKL
jgi:Zn-dependent oligopeptidase